MVFCTRPTRSAQPSKLSKKALYARRTCGGKNKYTFLAPFNDVGGSDGNPGKKRGKSHVKDGWSKPYHMKSHST